MRDIAVTAYYKDGSSRLLKSWNVKYLGYKRNGVERPVRYETHTVLDQFQLEFLCNSTGRGDPSLKLHDRVTITKQP